MLYCLVNVNSWSLDPRIFWTIRFCIISLLHSHFKAKKGFHSALNALLGSVSVTHTVHNWDSQLTEGVETNLGANSSLIFYAKFSFVFNRSEVSSLGFNSEKTQANTSCSNTNNITNMFSFLHSHNRSIKATFCPNPRQNLTGIFAVIHAPARGVNMPSENKLLKKEVCVSLACLYCNSWFSLCVYSTNTADL